MTLRADRASRLRLSLRPLLADYQRQFEDLLSPRQLLKGSVYEFHKVIEPLTHPERHGGDARDAFHVVAPSLTGYGWSERIGRAHEGRMSSVAVVSAQRDSSSAGSPAAKAEISPLGIH